MWEQAGVMDERVLSLWKNYTGYYEEFKCSEGEADHVSFVT